MNRLKKNLIYSRWNWFCRLALSSSLRRFFLATFITILFGETPGDMGLQMRSNEETGVGVTRYEARRGHTL